MSRVAIVTDSVSDLAPSEAKQYGITVVPLYVTFGEKEYLAGVDLTSEDFWRELTKPGAPFPKTAAPPPGAFKETFERLFAEGADEIVYVGVGSKLSATVASAKVARDEMPDKKDRIFIIDTATASMGVTLLARMAATMAAAGTGGADIAAEIERRLGDVKLYVALETLEYLKRGGRISPARAAIGSLLSVKPIITMEDGIVDTADRPRTRGKARARVIELLAQQEVEQVWVLHGQAEHIDVFADDLATALRFPRDQISIHLIGPSVGPHIGPGAYGAVVLIKR